MLVLFFLWPTITHIRLPKIDKAQIRGDRTELVHPRYEGEDEGGQRFTLTADRAIQTRTDPEHTTLIAPTATLIKKDEAAGPHVSAQGGIYADKSQHLDLTGDVTLSTPAGETFTTSAAEVDLRTKVVRGNQPIQGGSPKMDVTANGFTYDHAGGLLTLTGPAKLIIHENANEKPVDPVPAAP